MDVAAMVRSNSHIISPRWLEFPPLLLYHQRAASLVIKPKCDHSPSRPWARDYTGFDGSGWTQYFASRGYIVMQPQYRGEVQVGDKELWMAGDAEWGQDAGR
jgi:hypothetical protein